MGDGLAKGGFTLNDRTAVRRVTRSRPIRTLLHARAAVGTGLAVTAGAIPRGPELRVPLGHP